MPERPEGRYRLLEGAHLDGNNSNEANDNVALLCRRCHRAHDYDEWAAAFGAWIRRRTAERITAKDRGRPISRLLELLDSGLPEEAAWERLWDEQHKEAS